MSERERWIVYPLLFLALGAALRDKIIKTTESQRIKCHGLMVLNDDDDPILVIGDDQFPDLRFQGEKDQGFLYAKGIEANKIAAGEITSNSVTGAKFIAPQDRVGVLRADAVVAKNYILTDGNKNFINLDGRYTMPLWRMIQAFQQQNNRGEPGSVHEAGAGGNAESTNPDTPPTETGSPRSGE